MRIGQPDAALGRLARPGHELAHSQIAESQLLRGAVLTRLSQPDEALESFGAARVHAFASACAAVEAELGYYTALRLFTIGEIDASESGAYQTLSLEPYAFEKTAYFTPLNQIRARAFDLLAAVEARRER